MWALVNNGTVGALSVAVEAPAGFVSTGTAEPKIGWTYDGAAFSEPMALRAEGLLNAGLVLTSAGAPALNGTYACDDITRSDVQAEVISLLLNSAFTNGGTVLAWADAAGASHTFDVAQYRSFATALGAFVGGCKAAINGQSTILPSGSAAIS